jgi:DNA uptake protein ComE-like DNA-binding protein
VTIQPEHRALVFIAAIAILGAGVRVARAVGSRSAPAAQPALEHQMQAADSAAKAGQRHKELLNGARSSQDTGASVGHRRRAASQSAKQTKVSGGAGALDRSGYIGDKLDLDVATAAQIHLLPGVSSAMARRIAADRMSRGPFLSLDGMRRVAGVGPRFAAQIDSFVTFSGTFQRGTAADTVIPPRQSRGRPPAGGRRGQPP